MNRYRANETSAQSSDPPTIVIGSLPPSIEALDYLWQLRAYNLHMVNVYAKALQHARDTAEAAGYKIAEIKRSMAAAKDAEQV